MKKKSAEDAFTIIEVLIAIMLVGLAIAGIVSANGYMTKVNYMGTQLSTAEFLIEQIRERTAVLTFDQVLELNDRQLSPPVDSQGQTLSDFSSYTQKITAVHVRDSNLMQIDAASSSHYVRVTVEICQGNSAISSESWIKADY